MSFMKAEKQIASAAAEFSLRWKGRGYEKGTPRYRRLASQLRPPLKITPEETEKLKEINRKYVQQDLLTALIPTVLRQPELNEQAQAVTTGEIIGWLTSRNGPNRDFTPTKIGNAMKKLGYIGTRTKKGMQYLVVRIFLEDLAREGKSIANQILVT